MRTSCPLTLLVGLLAPALAVASPSVEVRKACGPVVQQLCAYSLSNETERRACMMKARSQWTPECAAAVQGQVGTARNKCKPLYAGMPDTMRACVQKELRG